MEEKVKIIKIPLNRNYVRMPIKKKRRHKQDRQKCIQHLLHNPSALATALFQRTQHITAAQKAQLIAQAAEQAGLLRRPLQCASCKHVLPLAMHHYNGYAIENACDVIFLCRSCHGKQNMKIRKANYQALAPSREPLRGLLVWLCSNNLAKIRSAFYVMAAKHSAEAQGIIRVGIMEKKFEPLP